MKYLWIFLFFACIPVPLLYTLYYFGILIIKATATWFSAGLSLPTCWEGYSTETSGFMRRNFAVFKKYHTLTIEVETNSGTLDCVVKGPDGSILSPASGSYGRDASVFIDVSRLKRCFVTLQMNHFNGKFRIALQ